MNKTNFSVGHNQSSDFIFTYKHFQHSVAVNYLLSAGGLAMPGYIFGSRHMYEHFFEANERNRPALIYKGLEIGIFTPYLNDHMREKGGLRGIACDLRDRQGTEISPGAEEVCKQLSSLNLSESEIKYLEKETADYGVIFEDIAKSKLRRNDYKGDEKFHQFWDETRTWRYGLIDEAVALSRVERKDGGRDDGLKVARITELLAKEVLTKTTSYDKMTKEERDGTFGTAALLDKIQDLQMKENVERFMKIVCLLFNQAISQAMDANHNWPVKDEDFFRFSEISPQNQIDLESDKEYFQEEIGIPSPTVLGYCDSSTLGKIYNFGEGYRGAFKEWSNSTDESIDANLIGNIKDKIHHYMEKVCKLLSLRENDHIHAKLCADLTSTPKVKFLLTNLSLPLISGATESFIKFGSPRVPSKCKVGMRKSMDVTLLSEPKSILSKASSFFK